jgi:hypothetical protein
MPTPSSLPWPDVRVEGVAAPAAVWAGFDLGADLDARDVEHRVLEVLEAGDSRPDLSTRTSFAPRCLERLPPCGCGMEPPPSGRPKLCTRPWCGTLVVLCEPDPVVVGNQDAAAECARIAVGSRDGLFGRCLRFPGQQRLVGVLPVHDVVSRSAIHRVSGSDWPVEQTDRLDTKGYVRPIFEGGCLVLRVGPAAEGLLVPNEVAEPHQCCSGRH